jgi:hypothetical protein
MTSIESIIVILGKISKIYDIPLEELLIVAEIKKEKEKKRTILQMIYIEDKVYYFDEINNTIYSKDKKKIGILCPETQEILFT